MLVFFYIINGINDGCPLLSYECRKGGKYIITFGRNKFQGGDIMFHDFFEIISVVWMIIQIVCKLFDIKKK